MTQRQNLKGRSAAVREAVQLDRDTFRRLVAEGQELRRAYEAETAKSRVITSEDLKIRSR